MSDLCILLDKAACLQNFEHGGAYANGHTDILAHALMIHQQHEQLPQSFGQRLVLRIRIVRYLMLRQRRCERAARSPSRIHCGSDNPIV